MDILLIRHGQAVEAAPGLGDAGRWLTAKGRKATRKVARWLARNRKRRPTTIWTSPLVRAVQTAEIVAAETRLRGEIRACAQLGPGHDPGDLLKLLAAEASATSSPAEEGREAVIALVGHEPSLSLIAHALLGDVAFTGLKKSGVLALTWEPAGDDAAASPGGLPSAPRTYASLPSAPRSWASLWFVLDPARMKSRKHLPTGADAAPPKTTPTG